MEKWTRKRPWWWIRRRVMDKKNFGGGYMEVVDRKVLVVNIEEVVNMEKLRSGYGDLAVIMEVGGSSIKGFSGGHSDSGYGGLGKGGDQGGYDGSLGGGYGGGQGGDSKTILVPVIKYVPVVQHVPVVEHIKVVTKSGGGGGGGRKKGVSGSDSLDIQVDMEALMVEVVNPVKDWRALEVDG
ncbi:hypothetical protein TNCT_569931 [Trichonephila clavata]|uniref:Uncharacterized protein n=1 Tax=Trichonephila clavata TaxID=2740835 RepID=A0A8X6FXZ5_TRICU|nr:hypothetical protein TNCT_569931 [Trichonephila clavata]